MSIPRSVRFQPEVERQIEAYLALNPIKFSELVNMAVSRFIAEKQTIELEPVDSAEFLKIAAKAFENHKDAMDKLK
ncbi:MAG: hypothetical protein V4490_03810 [Pseudomonadota bacterium]